MLVFWKLGYEGASLSALTEAMGINRPTLYASFGDKEQLFREALAMYLNLHAAKYEAALRLPSLKGAAEAWLRLTGGVRHDGDVPSGCLVVQGALVGSPGSQRIQEEIAAVRIAATRGLQERCKRAKREDDLPGVWEPEQLAEYLSAVASGLAVQSINGTSRAALNKVVDAVIANWPTHHKCS